MPAYNSGQTLVASVTSVICQTYKEWELIIINDNSTDMTYDIAYHLTKKSNNIKLISNKYRSGVANARNVGIRQAAGNYIAFLDSDDFWASNKLEKQLPYLESNSFSVVFSWYYLLDKNGKLTPILYAPKTIDYNQLIKFNFIGNLTAVYNTKYLGKIFQKNIGHEDYAFWLKILRESKMDAYCVQEPLATYRHSANSLSANKIRCVKWIFDVYNKCEKFNKKKSILLLCRNLVYHALFRIKGHGYNYYY